MLRFAAISATLAILGMMGALWYASTRGTADALAACRGGAVAGEIGGPFTLVNGQGETVTDADVFTAPTLLYFGYTFCPDICPLDMARNAEAVDLLEQRGIVAQPVFISIDPERDTPEVVGEFADVFHERAIGLTGSPEQVAEASRAYRTYYKAQKAGADAFYLVDHSTFSYLVLPDRGFVDFIRREDSAEAVAERMACFAGNA